MITARKAFTERVHLSRSAAAVLTSDHDLLSILLLFFAPPPFSSTYSVHVHSLTVYCPINKQEHNNGIITIIIIICRLTGKNKDVQKWGEGSSRCHLHGNAQWHDESIKVLELTDQDKQPKLIYWFGTEATVVELSHRLPGSWLTGMVPDDHSLNRWDSKLN